MSAPMAPAARPWRIIAAEITKEQDSQKIVELVQELDRALTEQEIGQPTIVNEASQSK